MSNQSVMKITKSYSQTHLIFFLVIVFSIVFLLYSSQKRREINQFLIKYNDSSRPTSNEFNESVIILYNNTNLEMESRSVDKNITILYWTKWYGSDPMMAQFSKPKIFINNKCILLDDRNFLNVSDAVIFHSRDVSVEDMPHTHPSNQIWVFNAHESPVMTYTDLKPYKNVFNWTMTYRNDSEVDHSYVRIVKEPTDPEKSFNKTLLESRTELVFWIVSHCRTQSKREEYAKELNKFIPVHIYGKCGNMSCPVDGADACLSNLSQRYKFYLSFENSMCADYVTEKLGNALKHNIIPIVIGGVDYQKKAPPNSVINVADFKSPKHLAEYLVLLHIDPDKYAEYFKWQKEYKVGGGFGFDMLCKKLVEQRQNPTKKVYSDLWEWWWHYTKNNSTKTEDACFEPNEIISFNSSAKSLRPLI